MRIYLQTPVTDEKPPRYYHLFIQEDLLGGWSLVREWGFQGSPGRMMRNHYNEWDEAEAALITARDQQVNRGYRVMFAEGRGPQGVGNSG